jgi:uncharacterized Ntn-hydrolase superfamily protein
MVADIRERLKGAMNRRHLLFLLVATLVGGNAHAQEPASWGEALRFSTFSIAAVDPATGESGVAVTTRVACVGNAVPHVRAGVGAVATQAFTRVEYGPELLEMLFAGADPSAALTRALAGDTLEAQRQVGVIALDGRSAQHTGSRTVAWAGHRAGPNYVIQGNLLRGEFVLDSVALAFERTSSSGRHLADRLIEALAAGQTAGGDARSGRAQSAAVIVADPRAGRSRRPDGVTADINVCEHPEPVAELRRIYDAISETLGYRTLQQQAGSDIWQLRIILHALGHYRAGQAELQRDLPSNLYTPDLVAAVDAFRLSEGLSTPALGSPPGLVDTETVQRLWTALERAGRADQVRDRIRDLTAVRR